jgi:hypothetical protein
MSMFDTDERLFEKWENNSEPEVGSPDGRTIFEDNDVTKYLWNSANQDEFIFSDTSMEVRR